MALTRPLVLLLAVMLGCTSTREVLRAADGGPRPPDAPFVPLTGLSTGLEHTCTVSSGAVRCTGSNRTSALGLVGADRQSLELLPGIDDALAIGAGYAFTCVLRNSGRLACFGGNDRGQLGTGDLAPRGRPTEVFLSAPVVSFASGFEHTCAILRTGALYCWGSNQENELGQGELEASVDRTVPVEVAPGVAFSDVSAGQGHTCAIAVDGSLFCMGRNSSGELGLGAGAPDRFTTPTEVGTRRYRHVAAGQNHTCAISADVDDGALYCWGQDRDNDGYAGPLGLPGEGTYFEPTRVGTESDWTALSTDTFHTCGLRAAGELWCWGRNAEGQLGVGDMSIVPDAVHLEPGSRFSAVEVGRFHTCARRMDGVVMCTGGNVAGELGVGDLERRAVLTPITE